MVPSSSISVIIPMYNAERTIAAALASVREQTCAAVEVLVVDNGSSDRSVALAEAHCPAAHLLHEGKRGPAAARNCGIAQARGAYLAFLDADDRMPADRLAFQRQALLSAPTIDMVFGRQYVFGDGEQPWRQAPSEWLPERIRPGEVAGAMMCRKSAFACAGVFDEALSAGEFIEWFARAQDAGLGAARPDHVVLFRRVHAGNLTRDQEATQRVYALALKQILQRRRGG
jgi:glycosyltransferase involved in cell wall biosynthesis